MRGDSWENRLRCFGGRPQDPTLTFVSPVPPAVPSTQQVCDWVAGRTR